MRVIGILMAETRTGAIIAAVTKQLNARRLQLDLADDLGEIVLTVRLMAGTTVIRSISVSEQYVHQRILRERPNR